MVKSRLNTPDITWINTWQQETCGWERLNKQIRYKSDHPQNLNRLVK